MSHKKNYNIKTDYLSIMREVWSILGDKIETKEDLDRCIKCRNCIIKSDVIETDSKIRILQLLDDKIIEDTRVYNIKFSEEAKLALGKGYKNRKVNK